VLFSFIDLWVFLRIPRYLFAGSTIDEAET